MRERSYVAAWLELIARAAALLALICVAHACTGPGLEPPERDHSGAGTGGLQDAGLEPDPMGGSSGAMGAGAGGSGAAGSGAGGFAPTGGTGGEDNEQDAGEGEMDASVDDEDGGVDPTND